MADFIRATISQIHIGERLRPIDQHYVEAIAASMSERGQISPIMIRKTPAKNKGATPYTLVAGGYRTTAAKLLGWSEIDAIVVEADALEAQLLEISENLYRNELNPLDRAIFVMKFRELWEEKNGKITPGGDRSKPHDADLIFAPGREVAKEVQERLGISNDKYERAVRIGRNLHPALRQAVRGTDAENDQSKLLKFAKLPTDDQVKVAAALRENPDIKPVLEWLKGPAPAVNVAADQAKLLAKLIAAWEAAGEDTRNEFLEHIGVADASGELGALMTSIRSEAA